MGDNLYKYSLESLRAIQTTNGIPDECDAVYILPGTKVHESGYMCLDLVFECGNTMFRLHDEYHDAIYIMDGRVTIDSMPPDGISRIQRSTYKLKVEDETTTINISLGRCLGERAE